MAVVRVEEMYWGWWDLIETVVNGEEDECEHVRVDYIVTYGQKTYNTVIAVIECSLLREILIEVRDALIAWGRTVLNEVSFLTSNQQQ